VKWFAPFVLLSGLTAQSLPNNWAGAGIAYNQFSTPQIAGWASYLHLISVPQAMYAGFSYDVTSATAHPFKIQTSTRLRVAMVVRQYQRLAIIGLGDAGMAVAGSNLGGAFSGGGAAIYKLNDGYTVMLGARILKTSLGQSQAIYEIGFGKAW
jgi:hypothetical protein